MTRHTPTFLTLGEGNFWRRPFTCTLTSEYRGVLGNFNDRMSDKPECAKTMELPRAGTNPSENICGSYAPWWGRLQEHLSGSWYFCLTAALKNGRTHHPHLR